ncbi:protein adenylyltransferase Fic [Fructobacillus evanidus]|uniref:protein adenylyltransferase n=1 Tax=Fructobacillus evanidus TaxID=3064281 RepID=A0ABM9MWT3_9LACO|nr:Fido [Fructobacillus sp. LMG 32999]CAK1229329.1 Fido [Fructobacillus sp. LMG 32999]CAK1231286.1 Fido [Fructobacillus sp. LMG 32999]CAK1231401.1 Fido [Fructobacillus sp. LMG 32999]CAK1232506.1 Fido [Fructobacillus sp. LMG 32999]
MLDNKLGLTSSMALAEAEERLTKKRAQQLYDSGKIKRIEIGSFEGLRQIHYFLFQDVYDFAGEIRQVNLSKGNFRFAPVIYLREALTMIDALPQNHFQEIVTKYVEMNVAHPFREGNGRATRIWLDLILKQSLGKVVDWSQVNPEDYLFAMERSPIRTTELSQLLEKSLTSEVNNREVYMKGVDQSYAYEGYQVFKTKDL